MAIMIPSEPPGNCNRFEIALFKSLQRVPARWTVFSDVFVEKFVGDPRPRQLDFVIIVPKLFAVFYIEAKAGWYKYSHDKARWLRNGQVLKNEDAPAEQVHSGMYDLKNAFQAFRKTIKQKGPLLLSFDGAVAFSDYDPTEEAQTSVHINKGTFLIGKHDVQDGNRIVQSIGGYAKRVRQQLNEINQENQICAVAQLVALEEMLNPPDTPITQDRFIRLDLETLLPELLKPTSEQAIVLDLTGRNDRCVIDGAAGTGKTVLAMELARNLCENEGKVVGFLCSNPNLSIRFEKWAETLSREKGGRVLAGTPTSLLDNALNEEEVFLSKHWARLEAAPSLEGTLKRGDLDSGWRSFVEETLADLEGKSPILDYLIVDEAQNLCDEVFLKLMDRMLKDGLANGRWAMFGDFVNQNIVTPRRKSSGEAIESLKAFGSYFSEVGLQVNCRNTDEIAATTYKITDIQSPTLPGIHGPEVEFKYIDSLEKLEDKLDEQLKDWQQYGFEPQQIVLLTPDADWLPKVKRRYGEWELVNIEETTSGGDIRVSGEDGSMVRYSEIHDFQGLESDLVILALPMAEGQTKIEGIITLPHYNYLNRLMYIAMSRANAMLVVIADDGYRLHLEPNL